MTKIRTKTKNCQVLFQLLLSAAQNFSDFYCDFIAFKKYKFKKIVSFTAKNISFRILKILIPSFYFSPYISTFFSKIVPKCFCANRNITKFSELMKIFLRIYFLR